MIKKIIASFLVICFFVNCTYSVSFAANSVPVYTGGYEGGLSQSDFFTQDAFNGAQAFCVSAAEPAHRKAS
mgnify:CR=1 FL=1